MKNENPSRKKSLREKLIPSSVRIPTEYQFQTWEYEGGRLKHSEDNIVIINGVLCETWKQKVRASMTGCWQNLKAFFIYRPRHRGIE